MVFAVQVGVVQRRVQAGFGQLVVAFRDGATLAGPDGGTALGRHRAATEGLATEGLATEGLATEGLATEG
ncbi:MAG TPA: hypothetical protein VFE65_37145, partial [Pseudonocardia sp.]|nr:hypothetical protein [Pseudonocardia sp.]